MFSLLLCKPVKFNARRVNSEGLGPFFWRVWVSIALKMTWVPHLSMEALGTVSYRGWVSTGRGFLMEPDSWTQTHF